MGFRACRDERARVRRDPSWEFLDLDEIPAVLFVLALCLIWYAGRRVRETSAELARRTDAERKLTDLLEDNRRLAQQHIEALESERKRLARSCTTTRAST